MFNFCPSCASKRITFNEGKLFRCPDCGFVYYHNVCAAAVCIISVPEEGGTPSGDGEKIVFLVRGKEPAAGLLDLPGGFIDPGEGVIDGLYRELKEEIGWTPGEIPKLYDSFANVYEYKGIKYNTCDMFFSVRAPGLKPEDLNLEKSEIAGVLFLKPEEIDFSKIAFASVAKALKKYLFNPRDFPY